MAIEVREIGQTRLGWKRNRGGYMKDSARGRRVTAGLRKNWLLASVGLFAGALWIGPAQADDDQETPSLEAITVTARKREERLIDVPVSANVLSAEDIGKYAISDPTDLNNIAPGLNIVREGGGAGPGAAISIRGISVFGQDNGLEQPVAIVVDGIPISRGFVMDAGLFDLADIQVL